MQRVLVLCATIVSFSTARGADIREQVRIDNAFVLEIGVTKRSAAFSPDGKILVTATTGGRSGIFGGGRTIFWDSATGKQLGPSTTAPTLEPLKLTGGRTVGPSTTATALGPSRLPRTVRHSPGPARVLNAMSVSGTCRPESSPGGSKGASTCVR